MLATRVKLRSWPVVPAHLEDGMGAGGCKRWHQWGAVCGYGSPGQHAQQLLSRGLAAEETRRRGLWSLNQDFSPAEGQLFRTITYHLSRITTALPTGSRTSPNFLVRDPRGQWGFLSHLSPSLTWWKESQHAPPLCRGPHGWQGSPLGSGGRGSAHCIPEEKGSREGPGGEAGQEVLSPRG